MKIITIVFLLLFLIGCATTFTGEAHLTPQQCISKCKSWDMDLDSMVAMGEYSDACVCKVRSESLRSSASTAGGAIGVIMQMREQEQSQQMNR